MNMKVTQGHQNCRYSIGHMSLPISGLYRVKNIPLSLPVFTVPWRHTGGLIE